MHGKLYSFLPITQKILSKLSQKQQSYYVFKIVTLFCKPTLKLSHCIEGKRCKIKSRPKGLNIVLLGIGHYEVIKAV